MTISDNVAVSTGERVTMQRQIENVWYAKGQTIGGIGHLFGATIQTLTGAPFGLTVHVDANATASHFASAPNTTARNLAQFLFENGAPADFLDTLARVIVGRCRDCGGRGYIEAENGVTLRNCTTCKGEASQDARATLDYAISEFERATLARRETL